jgi:heme exporter protein CcmD
MDLGPYAAFIWAAYGATGLLIGGLVAYFVAEGRRYRRELEALEARGVSRQPAGPAKAEQPNG